MVETSLLSLIRERVLSFTASRTGRDTAEDIAQETMLVLHNRYSHLTEASDLVPVALQIARFKISAYFRKMKSRGENEPVPMDEIQLPNGAVDPDTLLIRKQLMGQIKDAIPKMGERCRQILRLKLEGYTFPEIQRELKASSLNTVYTWDLRCRKSLLELVGGRWSAAGREI